MELISIKAKAKERVKELGMSYPLIRAEDGSKEPWQNGVKYIADGKIYAVIVPIKETSLGINLQKENDIYVKKYEILFYPEEDDLDIERYQGVLIDNAEYFFSEIDMLGPADNIVLYTGVIGK